MNEEFKDIARALVQVKDEFARLNELLKELDPEKAIATIIKLSEFCQCDSWSDALAYRFLISDPQEKKQLEILSQIHYMKMSNIFLKRLPQIDEIFKRVVQSVQQARNRNHPKPY